jgi:RNA polymerase sigma-70 factor (ECF subfamily)
VKPKTEAPTDGELLTQARNGRTESFAQLVDRHKDILVNYLTRLTGRTERAEDLAQEAFLRLYSAAGGYEERGQLRAYLFRIATNLLRSEERRSARWRRLRALFPSANGHSGFAAASQESRLLSAEIGSRVGSAIAQLPLRYRAPLVLREIEGLTYREIGSALDCREGTVKSRIHRGRLLLRDRLEPYWNGGGS